MIVLWTLAFVVGLVVASLASRRAVAAALDAVAASHASAGFIGMTVMAIGTDLPEIANSVISAATGHGDLVVGDAAGSAMTQLTLVLAILCFGTPLYSERRSVIVLGTLTAVALVAIAFVISDGSFDRIDGLGLVVAWLVTLVALRSLSGDTSSPRQKSGGAGRHIAIAGGWLIVVAIAATVVVQSFVEITETIGVPEIVAGAILLALGTSLPELIVDWTAIRRGAAALALGDLFGSSLLDATLALGLGPALTPTAVSAEAATACVIAAIGVLAATAVVAYRQPLTRTSALLLLGAYAVATAGLIAFAQ